MKQNLKDKKRERMQRAWRAYKAGIDDGKVNARRTIALNAKTIRDYSRGFEKGEAIRLAEEANKSTFSRLWRAICRRSRLTK